MHENAPPARPERERPPAPDDRTELERELLEHRDLVERLLEEMPAGFISVDDQLRVTFINPTAERMWAFSRDDVLGRGIWELYPDAATSEATEAISRMASTGEAVQFETFYEPDRRWIQVFAYPSGDGFSAFFLDVTARRVAELEREAAEARYRDIVEEVPAITYLDDEFEGRGRVIYVSPQSKEILGYSPEEWRLNRNLWERLIHPEDLEAVAAENARCRELGLPFEAEYRMFARDGRLVWFHDRSTPVLNETGRPRLMHGVMVDITAHRLAMETIKRKESMLAAVGSAAEHLLRADTWEAAIDDVLARLGEASGVDRITLVELEIDGDDVRGTSRAEWRAGEVESIQDRFQNYPLPFLRDWLPGLRAGESLVASSDPGSSYELPEWVPLRSTAVAPVILGSALWGVLGLGDVGTPREWSAAELEAVAGTAAAIAAAMARQRAERELRESEERFRRLADEAPDIIFRYRLAPRPHLEYVSPAVEAMTGYAPEEVLADPDMMFRLIHPEDLPRFREMLANAGREHTLRWIRRDGRVVWTEQRNVTVTDEEGVVVEIEGISRDVTDRVEAQTRLRASFEALSRSNEERRRLLARLVTAQEEERRRVANDIHDDSIQIMTAVGLRLALVRDQVTDPSAERTLAAAEETVTLAIRRLRRLLFELHPLSLDNSGLTAALRDHLRSMEEGGGPTFSLADELDADPPAGSRTILYRIAQEALTNIRKHSRAAHVSVTLRAEGDGIRMAIRDDGVGFDPAVAEGGILGHVGLPAMRERAQLAAGWFRIESAEGRGASVECWIPRIVAGSEAASMATDADRAPAAAADPA